MGFRGVIRCYHKRICTYICKPFRCVCVYISDGQLEIIVATSLGFIYIFHANSGRPLDGFPLVMSEIQAQVPILGGFRGLLCCLVVFYGCFLLFGCGLPLFHRVLGGLLWLFGAALGLFIVVWCCFMVFYSCLVVLTVVEVVCGELRCCCGCLAVFMIVLMVCSVFFLGLFNGV